MFYQLKNAIKKIFIREIKELIKDHPEFHNVLVVNKFQDREREKCNVIVRSASATGQRMSLDNTGLMVQSYTNLSNLKGQRGDMIEWVRDDLKNIQNLAAPGFYIIRMDTQSSFIVEPYYTIRNEQLEISGVNPSGNPVINLRHDNVNQGSELILDGYKRRFVKDLHYTIDYTTGQIEFLQDISNTWGLQASYQYIMDQRGPYNVIPYTMNNEAIPGVVLAFGDRLREGDIQVVVVHEKRMDTAIVKTGRWNMSLDLNIMAQDTDTAERLADFISVSLWALKQEEFADRGISITDFSLAGESEEPELDVPEEWNFSDVFSLSLLVDWEMHIPLITRLEDIAILPPVDTGIYDDETLVDAKKSFQQCIKPEFGTVDDSREGRYNDFNEGSKHFYGLVPITTVKSTIVSPNVIF